MITKFNDFLNEGLFGKKYGVPVLPDNLFQNKNTERAKAVQSLLRKAQDDGAFRDGLSDEKMKKFIDELIAITDLYGFGRGEKNFEEYINGKIDLSSSRVQQFWMDVVDFYDKNYK
jgi:hypothetical protein